MKKAKSSLATPSNSIDGSYAKLHGGVPEKKSIEAINQENTPKKAPQSAGN